MFIFSESSSSRELEEMTRANWPQMEVVASIEGEGMRCCRRSKADLWQINGSIVSLISIRKHLLLIVSLLHQLQQVTALLFTLCLHECMFMSVKCVRDTVIYSNERTCQTWQS